MSRRQYACPRSIEDWYRGLPTGKTDLTWYEYWQKFEHGGAQSFLSFGADGFVTHEMAHFLHSPDDVLLDPYWGWKFTEDSPFDQDRLALPEFLDEVEVISIQTILHGGGRRNRPPAVCCDLPGPRDLRSTGPGSHRRSPVGYAPLPEAHSCFPVV